ncbi:MAG: hypothetical protein WCO42_00475 [bacterium]
MNVVSKKSYFLYEGDNEDGLELLVADYQNDKALFRKDGEEAWIGLYDVKSDTPGAALAVAAGRRGMGVVSNIARNAPPTPPPEPVKPVYTGEALEKHLKDYQMELIRAGGEKGPPLPMELTPEMDQQLVKEGVLAPLE